jgi:hypothetical protein
VFLFPRERMIDACCFCFCFCFSPLWIVEDHEGKKKAVIGLVLSRSLVLQFR